MTEQMNNLEIQLNANIIKRLKFHDLYVDHMGTCLIIMLALQEGRYDILDEFDDNNRSKRAIILYRQLERRGFLELAKADYLYKLTKKAEILLEFVKNEYTKENKEFKLEALDIVEELPIVKKDIETVSDWIHEYINMFPDQFRDHPKMVIKRMEEFMAQYQYNKSTILGATKMYMNEQENSPAGHQYTRRSTYFIYKGIGANQVCDLATWCQKYLDRGKKDELDTNFMNIA